MVNICENFAKRLKYIRESKNLSKGKLSALAGLDISYIGKIERCEKFPNIKTIAKLAIALEIHPKELFDFE